MIGAMTRLPRDPTTRFSDRVDNYVKYRPGYPLQIVALLAEHCGLTPQSVVADIGSGTGLLSRPFLANGNRVYGVEPNDEMRLAGESILRRYPQFCSVDGTAEATGLGAGSIDIVIAGQAFHWFDPVKARAEFVRILRPGGWVALVWNTRSKSAKGFLPAYERLLQTYGTDYAEIQSRHSEHGSIAAFFAPGQLKHRAFDNQQAFDYEGLEGRLLSCSYAPREGQPGHAEMIAELRRIFDIHNSNGKVTFDYNTNVYYGQLAHSSGP